ncbi:MAG TPA: N-acetylmuramoyl-L-alanine amidase [Gaiellaceae bacterium]|nr:N-acetylmuramoyl-L-alanine amidase [Gaiellaceae bacterium]
MGSVRRAALVAALAALLVASADASALTRQRVGIVPSTNFTPAHGRRVTTIVIHVAETSFWGTVRTLRDPEREASAHFVVSHEGELVQLVDPDDVAWHAGNRDVNEHSIGIEHEGFTSVRGSITPAELDASARLVAYLAARYGIPLDRAHVIGHDEVPDPNDRRLSGGANHHTDPGPYWPWDEYMQLVRQYAQSPEAPVFQRVRSTRPSLPVHRVACFTRSVHSTTIASGQTVTGLVPWDALACGRSLTRVDFLVDGKLLWAAKRRPFRFARGRGWNTTGLLDGWHRLTLRAHGPRGYRIRRDLRVRVENRLYEAPLAGLEAGRPVAAETALWVRPTAATERVELRVDGRPVAVETAAPFTFDWDPSDLAAGRHELQVAAHAWDGRTAETTVTVEVAHPLVDPAVAQLLASVSAT